jgi:hypothetical protein
MVVGTLKEAHRTAQGFEAAGEATTFSYQLSEVTSEVGVDALDVMGKFFLDTHIMGVSVGYIKSNTPSSHH